jgi:hypothetical protein
MNQRLFTPGSQIFATHFRKYRLTPDASAFGPSNRDFGRIGHLVAGRCAEWPLSPKPPRRRKTPSTPEN